MRINKWLLSGLLLLALLAAIAPQRAGAQASLHLSAASVDIWPEYDQPASVLVVENIILAPGTVLPATLQARVPANAQRLLVAYQDPVQQTLFNAEYTSRSQEPWLLLTITATSLTMQVEYYLPLDKNGQARHIVYTWLSDYAVDALDINFLRPFASQSPEFSLAPATTTTDLDGLTTYHIKAGNQAAGTPFNLTVDYQRNTDDLVKPSQAVQAVTTPGADTPGSASLTTILPWVLGAIGVLLLIAGIAAFLRQRGQARRKAAPPARKRMRSQRAGDAAQIYCHECGRRAQPEDVFCRACGTHLRKESA